MEEHDAEIVLKHEKLRLPREVAEELREQARKHGEAVRCPALLVELSEGVGADDVRLEAEACYAVLAAASWETLVPGLGAIAEIRPSLGELKAILACVFVKTVQLNAPFTPSESDREEVGR
jgi:hypothetical protein